MAKWQTTSMADVDRLTKMSFNYLIRNFSKFSQINKIKVALKLVEKFIDIQGKDDADTGNTYITNIIASFNTDGNRELTGSERGRIGEAMGILEENMRQERPVSVN